LRVASRRVASRRALHLLSSSTPVSLSLLNLATTTTTIIMTIMTPPL
jgi:hypothetical protein